MRYVIGDTHFGHDNIIEYCERPFDSVAEMNDELVRRWNNKISERDTVIHLGDVRHHPDPATTAHWLEQLNGEVLLIRGNHDGDVGQNEAYHTATSATIQHGRYDFYLEHQPVGFSGWQIHGHAHCNDLVNYPLINRASQRANVSVELIGYRPLSLEKLVKLLDSGGRYERIEDAE